jgi:hypothetical protein
MSQILLTIDSKLTNMTFWKIQKIRRRSEQRRLTVTRGSIESDRFQRLSKLKSVTELFQMFDMDGKRFVAERFGKIQEGVWGFQLFFLVQQQIIPLTNN